MLARKTMAHVELHYCYCYCYCHCHCHCYCHCHSCCCYIIITIIITITIITIFYYYFHHFYYWYYHYYHYHCYNYNFIITIIIIIIEYLPMLFIYCLVTSLPLVLYEKKRDVTNCEINGCYLYWIMGTNVTISGAIQCFIPNNISIDFCKYWELLSFLAHISITICLEQPNTERLQGTTYNIMTAWFPPPLSKRLCNTHANLVDRFSAEAYDLHIGAV